MTDQTRQPSETTQPQPPGRQPLEGLRMPEREGHPGQGAHGGHGLLMIACCIPMLVIVGILVATGVVGSGVIVYALVCTAMMGAMMFAMSGSGRH